MVAGNLSRSLVYGRRGIVCSNSPLAASAGIQVMQGGGNAFDAALAVAATEAVTLVPLCSMGGDSFILAYEAVTGQLTGINSSGAAPTGATADYYRSRGHETMPIDGPHSITVPGRSPRGRKCTVASVPCLSTGCWGLPLGMPKKASPFRPE